MKVYPIQNRISQITFGKKEDTQISTQANGFLAVQNSDKLSFEKNFELTNDADVLQSNPLKALGCKIVKAYNVLFTPQTGIEDTSVYVPYYWMG